MNSGKKWVRSEYEIKWKDGMSGLLSTNEWNASSARCRDTIYWQSDVFLYFDAIYQLTLCAILRGNSVK